MKTRGKSLALPVLALVFASLACNLLTGGSPSGDGADTTIESPTAVSVVEPTATAEASPAPTPEPTLSIALGEEYQYAPGGFAFYELPGWEVSEEAGFLAHQPPDADPELGPVILLSPQIYLEDMTLAQAFDNFLLGFDTDGGGVDLGTPFDLEIGGYPARAVDITGTAESAEMLGQILVVSVSPRQALEVFGYSVADRWDSEISGLYGAFTGSLTFFEPISAAENPPPDPSGDLLRQWAIFAFASSEYTDTSWSALRATGAPDVYPDCGDVPEAWAPLEYGTSDWLELAFETPVYATEVNIYESHNPGQIVAVDLLDADGTPYTVYTAAPEILSDCGSVLTIYPELDVPVTGVVIYVNTVLVNDWTEIDAVELVGMPAGP